MRLIQNLLGWLRAFAHWLMEAWRVGVFVLLPLLVLFLAASQLPVTVADRIIRYYGLILQLLGILTVVRGLQNKQRLFNRPSLIEHIRRWWSRRPRWGAGPQTFSGAGTVSASASFSARASVWHGAHAEASVEARLAALEANALTLRAEQAETAKELQELASRANEALNSERRARESAVTTLRKQLEGFGVGGLHVEMIGVFWLVLGIVLVTVPIEIAGALRWDG